MTEGIIIALVTGSVAIISNIIIAAFNNTKTIYRIDQLEKKVEKHNNLVERMAVVERDEKTLFHRYDEISAKVEKYHG